MSIGFKVFLLLVAVVAVVAAWRIERRNDRRQRSMFHQYGLGDDE